MSFRVSNVDLKLISQTHSFRCDAKHYASDIILLDRKIRNVEFFEIGEYLPRNFIKGVQHTYLDLRADDSVPVVNTLAVQKMEINEGDCRHISKDDFDELDAERRLKPNDVLLTGTVV